MNWEGRRVVVMGLGRFGGGVGVARFLAQRGADVLVTDQLPAEDLAQSVAKLSGLPLDYRLGAHNVSDFTTADLIVVNPAVDPRGNRFLRAAAAAGVPTTSEIRLLTQHLPRRERVIGVTGSVGKSTTTAMIAHALGRLLQGAGRRAHAGGNLGGSLLGALDAIGPDDWVVLELSSFMLEGLDADRWSPHIAVVTNLAPNHLDRHGTFEAYVAAKQTILEHQRPGDLCVIGPGAQKLMRPMVQQVFLRDALEPVALAVPGAHNRENAQLAVAALAAAGFDAAAAREALAEFAGLPHRLQLAVEHQGVRFVNDSKSTTPESAITAIGAFEPGAVHAILGGSDKGSDTAALAQVAAARCAAVYTIGATGEAVAAAVEAVPGRRAEVVRCGDLDRAVAQAVARARRGEVVLLSPGFASLDQFTHFEQRGERFIELALRLTTEAGHTPR